MPQRKFEIRRMLGASLSFLLLASIIALFFAYRQRIGVLHAPPFQVSIAESARTTPSARSTGCWRHMCWRLLFSIVYGLYAARSKAYERVMIPAIDIAQSVPVVGFFPAAVYFFVALGHGRRLGVEMAAIFLIFTSQAWNMALGVFEAVRTIPLIRPRCSNAFGVSGWLKFRRLLLPASVPKLVYNSILSWVAGWYYLIACEIITVGPGALSAARTGKPADGGGGQGPMERSYRRAADAARHHRRDGFDGLAAALGVGGEVPL